MVQEWVRNENGNENENEIENERIKLVCLVVFGKKESCNNLEVNPTYQYQDCFSKFGATRRKQQQAFAEADISKAMPQADKENYNNKFSQFKKQIMPLSYELFSERGQEVKLEREEQLKYQTNFVCLDREDDELESKGSLKKPEKFGCNIRCSLCCYSYCCCFLTKKSDDIVVGLREGATTTTLASTVVANSGELSKKNNDRIRRRKAVLFGTQVPGYEANQIQSPQNNISNINNKFILVNHLKTKERLKFRHLNALKLQSKAHFIKQHHNYSREFAAKAKNTTKFTKSTRAKVFHVLAQMLTLAILVNSFSVAESVDCFKCSSRNGSNPACEDPFHNLNTTKITSPFMPDPAPSVIYHTPCYAGKKGREGLFPASACIKLTGTFARMSHCGKFQFEGDLLKGCVLACPEDACNSTQPNRVLSEMPLTFFISIFASILAYYLTTSSSGLSYH